MKIKPGTTYEIGLIQAQAYRRLQNHYHLALKPFKLSIPEWSLLGTLYDGHAMTPSDLAKALKSKVSHPSALISSLEKRGLLSRQADGTDKRSIQVSLTSKGQQLVPEVEKQVRKSLRNDLKDLNPAELLTYYNLLNKLAKGLADDS